jgi:hypothetical protein
MACFPQSAANGKAVTPPPSGKASLPGCTTYPLLHQEQILRTGQDKLPRTVAMRVDLLFDVGQQARCVLDFVVDDGRRVELQKSARIADGGSPDVRRLQGDDAKSCLIQMPEQRGLPRLARPGTTWKPMDRSPTCLAGCISSWAAQAKRCIIGAELKEASYEMAGLYHGRSGCMPWKSMHLGHADHGVGCAR